MWFDQKPKMKEEYRVFHCQTGSDDDDDKKEQRSKKEREKDQSAWDMKVVNDVCCVWCVSKCPRSIDFLGLAWMSYHVCLFYTSFIAKKFCRWPYTVLYGIHCTMYGKPWNRGKKRRKKKLGGGGGIEFLKTKISF